MNPIGTLLAAIAGYLSGSLSFARIVVRAVTGGDVETVALELPTTGETLTVDAVSATAVRLQLGARYGILTGILDMLKVTLPARWLRRRYPDHPYFLIAAAAGVFGHNWPVYHRFRGGRGQSPIMGGMFAVDPVAVPALNAVGAPIGAYVLRNFFATTGLWIALLPVWFWLRRRSAAEPRLLRAHILYGVAVNVAFWLSRGEEFAKYRDMQRRGVVPDIRDMNRVMRYDEFIADVRRRFKRAR